jgi:hypothetical protein
LVLYINLIFDKDFRHTKPTIHKHFPIFKNPLNEVTQLLSETFNSQTNTFLNSFYGKGYYIRVNLVKLLKGGDIPEHIDETFSLSHSHRIHLPIITNDKVVFTVGGESLCLKEGEMYEINNKHHHKVANLGDHDRVHMILDWVVPGEQCCCGKKDHPDIPCNPHACKVFDFANQPCNCLD